MKMSTDQTAKNVRAEIELAQPGALQEIYVKFRLPKTHQLQTATVNGHPTQVGGIHRDTVIASSANATNFEVVAAFN